MRKFTLTAIAIKDEKVVGAFKVLEQTPKFDGALLSCALSKFVELQYQELVFDPSKVLFVDLHWLRSNFGKLSVDELAFSVWRAATALRNSNALEVEGVKHGSNWLVKLDDEPFDVKFVLEDQAQNYIVLNALPVLEPTVVIEDSGWLHNNVEPQTTVLPDSVLEPARVSSVGVHMKMKNEFEFSQEDPGPTEILAAFKKGYMDGAKSTALDSGMFEKPVSEGFAEGLGEIYDRMVDDRLASKALLSDEQDGFLAEAALRGQNAAIVMLDESPYIPSEEVREAAKAVLLESNPVYNHYENGSDIPTNHTELNNPTLEI